MYYKSKDATLLGYQPSYYPKTFYSQASEILSLLLINILLFKMFLSIL